MADDQAPAQRRWRAACPNCGAPVEFASAHSASAVCSFCRSTLLRDGDALLRTGESAELFADYSPLQIGTQGTWQSEPFTVLGRVQLAYDGGRWSEWHAYFDNSGKSAWLSEDNGRFVMSWPLSLAQPPAPTALVLGAQQVVDGEGYRVAALTPATLHAAEGELPQPPKLGQAVFVAELRSSRDSVGTLEYVEGEAPRWSVGRPVELGQLKLANLREESAADLGKGGAGRSLACPHCGAPIQPQLNQSLSVTCGQCQSVVDLSGGPGEALRHHQQAIGMEPPIPLGRTGKLSLLKGGAREPWQVVGFLERCSRGDDEQYFWREYLLYNRQRGFAFLVDSEEGWSLVSVLTGAPTPVGAGVQWQGQQFNLHERYQAVTTHVLGEFYWRVKRDEVGDVADYRRGDQFLSCERSGNEITWSLGRAMDAAEVAQAFGLNPQQQKQIQRDASPLSSAGDTLKGLLVFALIAIAVVVLMKACSDEPCDRTKQTFGAQSAEYQSCLANQRRSGGYYGGSGSGSGGSWGGGFGGGGHK
ncbi:DUF4178 domain-containing protein [Inhella crocodyli]|uniref:DUF4178 domain-containing protein n=1 Tax=Inhella crocodyli TaxID=2499851 RepID=A0A3S2UKT4_9BURK|nr:DUF4178 domain-containing protein [Inhella crocodyli]RVT88485.1 DUF4178 domain-containing protein [Inhella crocodyli]